MGLYRGQRLRFSRQNVVSIQLSAHSTDGLTREEVVAELDQARAQLRQTLTV